MTGRSIGITGIIQEKRNWLVKRNPYNYSCRMCYSGVSAYTALKWKFIKFQQAAIVSLGLGPGNE